MVGFEQVEPTGLVGTGQLHLRPLGQRLIPGEVGGVHRSVLPGLDETLGGVLAGDFEKPESARARFGLQQRFVHQGGEQVEHVEGLDAAAGAHLPGGFEAETTWRTPTSGAATSVPDTGSVAIDKSASPCLPTAYVTPPNIATS